MTKVSDSARVSASRDAFQDTVTKAWQVWDAATRQARSRGGGPMRGPNALEGVKFNGSMSEVIRVTFPASRFYPQDDWDAFSRGITAHLRATNNAICTSQSHPITWWLSAVWNDTAAGHERDPDPRDTREARLTPEEAGETRDPNPVRVVRSRPSAPAGEASAPAPAPPEPSEPSEPSDPSDPSDPTLSHQERLLELFARYPDEPLTSMELAAALDDLEVARPSSRATKTGRPIVARLPIAGSATRRSLAKLVKARKLYKRFETTPERRVRAGMTDDEAPAGRPALLYSTKRKVPPRTVREVLPGVKLGLPVLPRDASAVQGAKVRSARNDRVLNALIELAKPVNVQRLMALTGLGRSVVEDALNDLHEAGLAHHDRPKRTGRDWLPIDVPFPSAPPPAPTSPTPPTPPTTSAHHATTPTSAAHRAIVRSGLVLAARRDGVIASEVAYDTGYSAGYCAEVLRVSEYFTHSGNRRRAKRYVLTSSLPVPTPAPPPLPPRPAPPAPPTPTPEAPVSSLTTAPTTTTTALDALHALAEQLGVPFAADSARVAELEAENAALRERVKKLAAMVAAAAEA